MSPPRCQIFLRNRDFTVRPCQWRTNFIFLFLLSSASSWTPSVWWTPKLCWHMWATSDIDFQFASCTHALISLNVTQTPPGGFTLVCSQQRGGSQLPLHKGSPLYQKVSAGAEREWRSTNCMRRTCPGIVNVLVIFLLRFSPHLRYWVYTSATVGFEFWFYLSVRSFPATVSKVDPVVHRVLKGFRCQIVKKTKFLTLNFNLQMEHLSCRAPPSSSLKWVLTTEMRAFSRPQVTHLWTQRL